MKNECEIVKDLLPLYADGLTSKASSEFVEEHLKTCEECASLLRSMKETLPAEEEVKNESELPLAQLSVKMKKKKTELAVLIASAAAAVLIALYSLLSAPVYLNYVSSINDTKVTPEGLLVSFTDKVHHVEVTTYTEPDSGTRFADIECWTSTLDQLWKAKPAGEQLVHGDVIMFRANVAGTMGKGDKKLYGDTDTNSYSLRRLTLNYWFLMSFAAAAVSAAAAFLLRKKRAGAFLKKLMLVPLSWCLSSIIVERGIGAATWSLQRDVTLIALLWISLSVLLISLLKRHEEKKAVRI